MSNNTEKINVLMVGVSSNRIGGMWTVAKEYIYNTSFNNHVNLKYISTSTNGSIIRRSLKMIFGFIEALFFLFFLKIDIVHIHMSEKGSVYRKGKIVKIAKVFNKKIILHMHAGSFLDWYNSLSEMNKKRVLSYLDDADYIIVLGEYWRNRLKALVNENKLIVLYNGVPLHNEIAYSTNNRFITYIGRINRNKGIYDLLDAIKQEKDKLIGDYKVILCGTDEEGKLNSEITRRNLNDIVEHRGWIEGDKKNAIIQNSIIIVLPSYYEGLSMTIIEAMSYGIPVITTSISTMPELVVNKRCLISPGDWKMLGQTIVEFVRDTDLLTEISMKEVNKVSQKFSLDSFINNTINIYRELLKE